VRNFEKVGLTRQQAEALTEHLTEVLCTHKEKLSEAYVTKAQLEKVGRLMSGPCSTVTAPMVAGLRFNSDICPCASDSATLLGCADSS
jgi:hypothetical protein